VVSQTQLAERAFQLFPVGGFLRNETYEQTRKRRVCSRRVTYRVSV
jgi:hypothetical protein